MATIDLADTAANVLTHVLKNANFTGGVVFGSLLSAGVFYASDRAAGKERRQRADHDREREKELREQLNIKDERINALHLNLEKVIKRQHT